MSTPVEDSVTLTDEDSRQLNAFRQQLNGKLPQITASDGQAAPDRLIEILAMLLNASANGRSFSVTQMPEFLTTTSAASLLGISRPTVMKLIRQGKLPAKMVGSHHRISTSAVLELLEERKQEMRDSVFEVLDIED